MKINRFNDISESYHMLNEGAWGHKPLDNDAASDWKWVFGKMIYTEIRDNLKKWMENDDLFNIYNAISTWLNPLLKLFLFAFA